MKRILSLCLVLALLFTSILVSCKETEPPDVKPPDTQDPGNNTENPNDKVEPEDKFVPISLKNQLDPAPVTTRCYYPIYTDFLQSLETLKNGIGTAVNTPAAIRSELRSLLRSAEDLGLYYDYHDQTYYTNGSEQYGAVPDADSFGGGEGYSQGIKKYVFVVTNDDQLHDVLKYAKSGEVIFIKGDIVIDLADYMMAGDIDGFQDKKIPYEFVIPAGVTLAGERGVDGKRGAILKSSSYVDIMLTLEKGARLTGLVLQGPDTKNNLGNITANQSSGILVQGDDAVIDNCEISGFYKNAIEVTNAKNVSIHHNYIHHISGKDSGLGLYLNNASVTVSNNLFSACTTLIFALGSDTNITFQNNVEAGSHLGENFFILNPLRENDSVYTKARAGIASLVCENNTFLSVATLASVKGIPTVLLAVRNNVFAYDEVYYDFDLASQKNFDASVYKERVQVEKNVWNILSPVILSKSSDGPQTAAKETMLPYSIQNEGTITPFTVVEKQAVAVTYAQNAKLTVLSASYYLDEDDLAYFYLDTLFQLEDQKISSHAVKMIQSAIDSIGGYTNYTTYLYKNMISLTSGGKTYGATGNEAGNLGGGEGYHQIFTTGDYVVKDKSELLLALSKAKSGEVIFIREGTIIDLGNAKEEKINTITLPAGVTLASNRGFVHEDGSVSTGAIIKTTYNTRKELITIGGDNVRVTGIVVQGGDPGRHLAHWDRCHAGTGPKLGTNYFYKLPVTEGIHCLYNNLEVDNCELSGFSYATIYLSGQDESASTGHKIHHNYIHHNQIKALGYGISMPRAYVEIYCNLFNYNRHSIAGSGWANSGYLAHDNVEFGASVSDYFDMHGGKDRKDGTDIAAEYVEIYNNTFLGDMKPYNLRGVPTSHRTFDYNIVLNSRASYDSKLYLRPTGYPQLTEDKLRVGSNIWNIKEGITTPVTGIRP